MAEGLAPQAFQKTALRSAGNVVHDNQGGYVRGLTSNYRTVTDRSVS